MQLEQMLDHHVADHRAVDQRVEAADVAVDPSFRAQRQQAMAARFVQDIAAHCPTDLEAVLELQVARQREVAANQAGKLVDHHARRRLLLAEHQVLQDQWAFFFC